jgi:energy-converting hydrogenase Eha subunit A
VFIRRKINAEVAKLMGAEVDKAQRALIVNPTPVNVGGVNTLAYGVFGYESLIWAIVNPYAICKSGDLSAYLA